jgi:hypothetical protein
MTESTNSQKMMLALATAQGMSTAEWASVYEVPVRTAYRWAADPEVRTEVESIRRRVLDEAIGRLANNSTQAVDRIVRLGKEATSDSVQLSANKAILSQYIAVSKYAGLEGRVAKLEDESRERAPDAS